MKNSLSNLNGKPRAAIIGGGIVGVVCAAYLDEAGFDVTVIDRTDICAECSKGNAGGLSYTEIAPLASPDILKQSFGWLLDPLGPLYLSPRHLPRAMPWLAQFALAARPSRYRKAMDTLSQLQRMAQAEWDNLIARFGIGEMVTHNGALSVYEDGDAFPGERHWADLAARGVEVEFFEGSAIRDLEPALSSKFVKAALLRPAAQVSDPYLFTKAIWDRLAAQGVSFRKGEVVDICPVDTLSVQLSDGQVIHADRVVVAAGIWSRPLARILGNSVPLETERGYNTTIAPLAGVLRREVIFSRHGFVATPLSTGLRIGGLSELAGITAAPNFRRADAMLDKARHFIPAIDGHTGEQWMGHRPSTPDSLPVIGHARRDRRVVYAFGHGHLGLTLAAATGRMVECLLTGKASPISATPFAPERFSLLPYRETSHKWATSAAMRGALWTRN